MGRFASALEVCPELLVREGTLTRRKPTPDEWRDVAFGWELAKEMVAFAFILLAAAWPVIYMVITVVKLLSKEQP